VSAVPSLSVIVPTHERPGQLGDCLTAIAALDYPGTDLEVIVVDDGGSAPLKPLVDRFRDDLSVTLLGQRQGGPAAARNAGAVAAGGDFLAFVDDDVVLDRGWPRATIREALARPGAAVGGRTVSLLTGNPYAATSERIIELAYEHYNSTAAGPRFFAANNMTVPAADFRAIGGFDPSFRTSEDRDFCDRWLESGRPLAYAPDAVAGHAPPLTLRSFLRQQFGYGRGAFAYHHARFRRGRGLSGFSLSFTALVMREAGRQLRRRDIRRVALLALWQLANLAGFSRQALVTLAGGRGPGEPHGDRLG
jgi:glycosyltransferase involved in cell wall biosynthesis